MHESIRLAGRSLARPSLRVGDLRASAVGAVSSTSVQRPVDERRTDGGWLAGCHCCPIATVDSLPALHSARWVACECAQVVASCGRLEWSAHGHCDCHCGWLPLSLGRSVPLGRRCGAIRRVIHWTSAAQRRALRQAFVRSAPFVRSLTHSHGRDNSDRTAVTRPIAASIAIPIIATPLSNCTHDALSPHPSRRLGVAPPSAQDQRAAAPTHSN